MKALGHHHGSTKTDGAEARHLLSCWLLALDGKCKESHGNNTRASEDLDKDDAEMKSINAKAKHMKADLESKQNAVLEGCGNDIRTI